MADSLGSAVKQHLEALGLGIPVFGRRAPKGTARPYITVEDQVSLVPEPAFPQFDDPEGHVRELVRVGVWQDERDAQGQKVEDRGIADRVVLGLKGGRLDAAPFPVAGVTVIGAPRVPDPDPNIVHHAITIAVSRTLARSAP